MFVGFAVSLVRRLVFYLVPCSSSGACGLRCLPCRKLPLGVSAFSDAVCLTYCCGSRPLWGLCSVHCLLSLALGWVRFWPKVSPAPVRCKVCCLGFPSWLVLLLSSLFVLHLLLRWGGLVTCLWPLLLLQCVGLLWGLCYAVLSAWTLARPPLQGLRWKIPLV